MTTVNPHGLHHVTAIASSPQRNVDFYTRTLGLRLVKQTVNFDAPDTYHLYYGDEQGSPSSLLTFFPWPDVPTGRQGAGMTTATAFSVPGSLARLVARTVRRPCGSTRRRRSTRDDEEVLTFRDPDGMVIDLVAADGDHRSGWDGVGDDPRRARRPRPARDHAVRAAARSVGHDVDRAARDEPDRRGRRPGPVRDGRRRLRCPGRRVRRRRATAACRPAAPSTTSPSARPTCRP